MSEIQMSYPLQPSPETTVLAFVLCSTILPVALNHACRRARKLLGGEGDVVVEEVRQVRRRLLFRYFHHGFSHVSLSRRWDLCLHRGA